MKYKVYFECPICGEILEVTKCRALCNCVINGLGLFKFEVQTDTLACLLELFEKFDIRFGMTEIIWRENIAYVYIDGELTFYNAKHIAELLGCSLNEAKKICVDDFKQRVK